jgi:hypothetical protein
MRSKVTAQTRPVSFRIDLSMIKEIAELAAKCGYSSNQFVEYSLQGIIEMIHAEKPIEPKIVSVAKFMLKHEPTFVSMREIK